MKTAFTSTHHASRTSFRDGTKLFHSAAQGCGDSGAIGAKYNNDEEEKVHKVFITYSFKVQKAVKEGKLIIQK